MNRRLFNLVSNRERANRVAVSDELVVGVFVDSQGIRIKKKKTHPCDRCGALIIQGKHCKPCSSIVPHDMSYSKPFWEK